LCAIPQSSQSKRLLELNVEWEIGPMATEKQIAANKRNAARSTGPRTSSGKDRSRMNALRHGLSYVGCDFRDLTKRSMLISRESAPYLKACSKFGMNDLGWLASSTTSLTQQRSTRSVSPSRELQQCRITKAGCIRPENVTSRLHHSNKTHNVVQLMSAKRTQFARTAGVAFIDENGGGPA